MRDFTYSELERAVAGYLEYVRQQAVLTLMVVQFKRHVYLDAVKPHRGRDKRL